MTSKYFREQSVALTLTALVFGALVALLWLEVTAVNKFIGEKIVIQIRPADVLIGMTIYLKTAIDFVIFIGRLMDKNPGLKGRIGIEIGTAIGNGIGTFAIVLVWAFFKEVNALLALMIFVAALVLLRLAQDTLVHGRDGRRNDWLQTVTVFLGKTLGAVNRVFDPLLSRIVPSQSLKVETKKSFVSLLLMALTVPFILGLDDFAGYVPVFAVVNVFGFAVGVFAGHMILNIALYLSPENTVKAVNNRLISVIGSVAFVGLAAWGFFETFRLLFLHG